MIEAMIDKLRRTVDGIYAALYLGSLRRWNGDATTAAGTTATALAGAILANVLLVYLLASILVWPPPHRIPAWFYLLPPVGILAAAYAHFVRRARYRELADEFEKRPAQEQRRTRLTAWLYLGLSYLVPIAIGWTLAARQR